MSEQNAILISKNQANIVDINGSVVEFIHLVNRLYDFVKNNEEKIIENILHFEPKTELDDKSLALTIKLVELDYFQDNEDNIKMLIASNEQEVNITSNIDGLYYFMQILIEMLEACKTKKKDETIEMFLESGVWILKDSLSLNIKVK